MDQLVKLAYAMKKKSFDTGSTIIQQGERMDHLWIVKSGLVKLSRKLVIQPYSIDQRGMRNRVSIGNGKPKQSIVVDIADIGATDAIGLIESMEESVIKSQRDAVAVAMTEMFFVP